MSESFPYSVGLNNVGSYQVSGMPFASASITAPASGSTPVKITFPYVTSWVSFGTTSNSHYRVGFSANGVKNGNYFIVHEENHPVQNIFPLKLTEVYLLSNNGSDASDCYIVAGLTNIPTARINNSAVSPSGSNWSGSYSQGVG